MQATDELKFFTSALIALMPHNSSTVVSHEEIVTTVLQLCAASSEEMCLFHKVPS